MKKMAVFIVVLLMIYIGSKLFFSGRLNPSSLNIDNKIINLPYKMHIETIFGHHQESLLGLTFAKSPYVINYPNNKRIYLILSNGKKNAIILLEPLLTELTLQKFSENNNSIILGDCILSDHQQKTFIIRNNHGYIIESEDNTLKKYLVKQFCPSSSHVSRGSPTQSHNTLK